MRVIRKLSNKTIVVLLVFVILIVSAVGCNENNNSSDNNDDPAIRYIAENELAYIWGAPDTVSVMKDVDVLTQSEKWGGEWLLNADKLYCEGIKGDTEAVQVMITAKKDIDVFDLAVSDLTIENGAATIDKSNIEIFAERYIEVKSQSSRKGSSFLGFYPDALVPIGAYKNRKENKIETNMNQGIWVNIFIPEDTQAGIYKGVCKLTLDGNSCDLPLTVKVYNVTMPSTVHANTAFDIFYDQILLFENEELEDENGDPVDWNEIYYDYVISKRITPQASYLVKTSALSTNYAKYVNEMISLAKNERITSYKLPFGTTGHEELGAVVDANKLVGLLTAMARKNIELIEAGEEIDLFEKAYFYLNTLIDEPSAAKIPIVKYCDKAITQAKKEVAETVFDEYLQAEHSVELIEKVSQIKASLLKLPHCVTSPVDRVEGNEDDGGVQTWVCQTQDYKKTVLSNISQRQTATDKYSQGEDFWSYMTMDSNSPYSSLQLDDNLLSSRSLFWINYNYNMHGILFWCVCWYSQFRAGTTTVRDVWNDPNSYLSANGDGYLLYPGSRYKLSTPISTLRLESLMQGSEDYEYIYLLERAIDEYNVAHNTEYDFKKIMTRFYGDVFKQGTMICETDLYDFTTARGELLTLLEAVVNDSESAASLLERYQAFQAD